jgi:Predicted ring-cleavage extradiol dioxygenase
MAGDFGIAAPGFRLPDETHIGRVRLQISDLDRSIAYYEKVLGLKVIERSSGSAQLGPKDENVVLIELIEKPGVRQVSRRGLLGLYHFAVLIPERASLGRFVVHLSEIGAYAGMSDHLVSEAVYLTDPDGLGIEVYADRPRESWKATDRQITMTTKPLDVQSVVAAANGKKWDGAPKGTRIGHVHFYVGDIEQAESFYHKALGLDKIVWNYPGALFMSAGGYHHHVGVNTWAEGAPTATDDDARLLDWELKLPNAESSMLLRAASSLRASMFHVMRMKQ